mmetsp:Transcript_6532/g.10213  ORF Transcript_6532/g.10213 Transcript_6532/m.10213 type:complete len:218 (+) Transcript_6532:575-1228(+)
MPLPCLERIRLEEAVATSLGMTESGWIQTRRPQSLTRGTTRRFFVGHGCHVIKGQVFKTGHGEEVTTALLASCSTPTCVSYLTLNLHFPAAQEPTCLEMTEIINAIGGTIILLVLSVAGLQTWKPKLPWSYFQVNAMVVGLIMTMGRSSMHSVKHGKKQLQTDGRAIFMTLHYLVAQPLRRLPLCRQPRQSRRQQYPRLPVRLVCLRLRRLHLVPLA